MDDKFKVLDENNIEHTAEVITAFSYKEKEYLNIKPSKTE